MSTWGYYLDKHLDEFEDIIKINKDARILDVAAGTGLVGQKVFINVGFVKCPVFHQIWLMLVVVFSFVLNGISVDGERLHEHRCSGWI